MENAVLNEYLAQAQALIEMGKSQQALPYLDKAEAEDRMNYNVYLIRGIACASMQDFPLAKENFEKVLKINRKERNTYFHLGNIAMLEGDKDKGISYYNSALENGFDGAQVNFVLGLAHEEADNIPLAMQHYKKAILIDGTRADVRVRNINLMVASQQFEAALKAVDELVLVRPDVVEGYHIRYLVLTALKRMEDAAAFLEECVALFPEDAQFIVHKVTMLSEQNKEAEAAEIISAALADETLVESVRYELYLQKAKIAARKSDAEQAIEALEAARACKFEDNSPKRKDEVHYLLMNCYIVTERYEQAISLAKLIKEDCKQGAFETAAYFYEPFAMAKLGQVEQAKAMYQQAVVDLRRISLAKTSRLDAYIFRAMCLKELEEYDKALELMDFVITVQPEFAECYTVKAHVLQAMGQVEQAKEMLIKAESLGSTLRSMTVLENK